MLDIFFDGDFQILAQNDQFGRLVQALIVPVGMLFSQDVADAVVFTQPNGRHDVEAWQDAEERVAQSDALFLWNVRWVRHLDTGRVFEQRRELLAVDNAHLHLSVAEAAQSVLCSHVQAVNVRHVHLFKSNELEI